MQSSERPIVIQSKDETTDIIQLLGIIFPFATLSHTCKLKDMYTLAFLQNINGPEILMIFLLALLFFGAKRLPDLFKSFGKSIKEFKKATSEIEDDFRTAMDEGSTDYKSTSAQTVTPSEPTQVAPLSEETNSERVSEVENSGKD